jgi:sodium-dependent dicarboxylate transporter 2/3/5
MGSASNAVASGFLAKLRVWSLVDWMVYGLPTFLLLFPLTWGVLRRLVPVTIDQLDTDRALRELDNATLRSPYEREILYTMLVTIVLWISGSFLETLLGLPPTLLSPTVIAVATVAYLSIRGIINWEDVKGVSWGFLFIIGAGLSLGETLSRTGTTQWLAEMLGPLLTAPPLLLSLVLLVVLSALLTNVINNATVVVIFVPMLLSLAETNPSLNVLQLVLPATFATTFGYSLPSASGRMALIAATGIVDPKDMARFGLILTVISSVSLAFFFYGLVLLQWI